MPTQQTHPLLEVLSELVVDLELLVEILKLVLVNVALLHGLHRRGLRGLEEVEERVDGHDLLDHTGPVGVWNKKILNGLSKRSDKGNGGSAHSCFAAS